MRGLAKTRIDLVMSRKVTARAPNVHHAKSGLMSLLLKSTKDKISTEARRSNAAPISETEPIIRARLLTHHKAKTNKR